MTEENQTSSTGKKLDQQEFFSEFSPNSYEEWKEAAIASLKGAPFEKKVFSKTYEEIELKPLYRMEDAADLPHVDSLPGFPPYVRHTDPAGYLARPWDICQAVPYGQPVDFNRAVRQDLERGQTAVLLPLDFPGRLGVDADQAQVGQVGRGGVSLSLLADLEEALDGIDLEQTPVFVPCGPSGLVLTGFFVGLAEKRGINLELVRGCLGADPLGELARQGSLPLTLEKAYDHLAAAASWRLKYAPGLQTILVDACGWHEAGASAVQELGYALGAGVEYIRAMLERGLEIDEIAPGLRFSFSIGSDFFMEIAKLRAARLLWTTVIEAFGGNESSRKMIMHARTSAWTKTVYDPHVNMLRNTTEAFAGVMGGVDSLQVAPFDEPIRPPDEFSRRVSRNLQLILREECHFTRPIDPAGGSWYVEVLTDQVARKAWEVFQKTEEGGGLARALAAGGPQKEIEATAKSREANLAKRKDVFVGTNMYPNLDEKPLEPDRTDYQALYDDRVRALAERRAPNPSPEISPADFQAAGSGAALVEAVKKSAQAGASLGQLSAAVNGPERESLEAPALRVHRGAEIFETLRRNMEEYQARTGGPLQVFLVNLGPIPQHKARADFTSGFFQVGGFQILTNDGFDSPETAVRAAVDSGAPIAVICSTDKVYPDLVPPVVKSIKAESPDMTVLLAGRPARDHEEAYLAAGLDGAIYLGADCRRILSDLQKKYGVIDEKKS